MKEYYLNLWDDFSDEGPAETWIQLESTDYGSDSIEDQKNILNHFLPLIKEKFTSKGVTAFMYFYDSKVLYPQMDDNLHAHMGWKHFQRWKIKLQGITQDIRQDFMDEMEDKTFKYNGYKVSFISES
jgi:hypothetical protein